MNLAEMKIRIEAAQQLRAKLYYIENTKDVLSCSVTTLDTSDHVVNLTDSQALRDTAIESLQADLASVEGLIKTLANLA